MWWKVAVFSLGIFIHNSATAQLQKFYTVKHNDSYEVIDFKLNATSGSCYIKPSDNDNPVEIFGNPDFEEINPSFSSIISQNKINTVTLNLEDYQKGGLTKTISYQVFETRKKEKNFWKIYFNKEKSYNLDLRYGIGTANLNLSGIPIHKMKVNTGSADVIVNYEDDLLNPVAMDTFFVKVDLGSMAAYNLMHSNASHVIANVGFGNALLDFSEESDRPCTIDASVVAGKLVVYIPQDKVPTIIHINNSPLCSIKLAEGFEEVEKNVFINMAYDAKASNLRTFNIDVAMGNVVFRHKD